MPITPQQTFSHHKSHAIKGAKSTTMHLANKGQLSPIFTRYYVKTVYVATWPFRPKNNYVTCTMGRTYYPTQTRTLLNTQTYCYPNHKLIRPENNVWIQQVN